MSIEHSPARQAIDQVRVRVLPDGRMTRRDAAQYLGIAVKTVVMWDLENPTKLGSVKVGGLPILLRKLP